jgi:hypothetical protein
MIVVWNTPSNVSNADGCLAPLKVSEMAIRLNFMLKIRDVIAGLLPS